MEKASKKKMKKWTNKKRHLREFQIRDLALVNMYAYTRLDGQHRGLVQHDEGHFPILKKVVTQAYKVELPSKIKYHLVFHLSLLKPYPIEKKWIQVGASLIRHMWA